MQRRTSRGKGAGVLETQVRPSPDFRRWVPETVLRRVFPVLPILLALALYAGILGHGFVYWDDAPMIQRAWENPLSWRYVKQTFTRVEGAYQPLRDLSYSLDARIFGERLWGFHLHTILLYGLNVWLVFLITRKWFQNASGREPPGEVSSLRTQSDSTVPALLAAGLFAAHPLHVETVAWLAGRKEVLAGFFYLLAFWGFLNLDRFKGIRGAACWGGAYLSYLLALGSKPSSAALPLALLAYDLIVLRPAAQEWKRRAFLHAPFWLPALAAVVYFTLFAGTVRTYPGMEHLAPRILQYFNVFGHSLETMAVPLNLCARYAFDVAVSLRTPGVLIGLGLHGAAAAVFLLFLKRDRLIAFLPVWLFIHLLPTSGWIPISTPAADRYLYLPSLAFCIAVPWVMVRKIPLLLSHRVSAAGSIGILLVSGLVAFYSVVTVQQARVWRDDGTLWMHTVQECPTDLAFYNLGEAHRRRNDLEGAESYFRRALAVNPAFPKALNGLGNLMLLQNRLPEARELYLQAVKSDPKYGAPHRHLGMLYHALRRYDLALDHAQEAFRLGPRDPVLVDMVCELYLRKGDAEKLLRAARYLGRYDAKAARAYMYQSVAFLELGRASAASRVRSRAYELNPEEAAALEAYFLKLRRNR